MGFNSGLKVLKSGNNGGTIHIDGCILGKVRVTRSLLLRMRNVSDKSFRVSQNMYSMFSNVFFLLCRSGDNVEKYCRAGQATGDMQ
jgi:hypothetical protein